MKLILIWAIASMSLFAIIIAVQNLTKINLFEQIDVIKPGRTPDGYKEDFTKDASKSILTKLDTGYLFNYKKSATKNHAFAGAFFPIEELLIDFESYKIIEIEISALKGKRIPIYLSMHYNDSTYRYLAEYLETCPQIRKIKLNIEEFQTPPSWFAEHGKSLTELPPESFDQIFTLSIGSCLVLGRDIEDKVYIKSIFLAKDFTILYWLIGICSLLTLFLVIMVIVIPQKLKRQILTVPYQKLEAKTVIKDRQAIIDFISVNYSNPNLKLSDLEKSLKISKNEISKFIRETSDLTFPQFLSKIRVDEAKRLLRNSKELSAAEVGYLVGFNSPSNFNRVFKTITGVSPKQFGEESQDNQ